jgi:hypothetical protein
MWEPQLLTTLRVFTACYRDSFTFFYPSLRFSYYNLYSGNENVYLLSHCYEYTFTAAGKLVTRLEYLTDVGPIIHKDYGFKNTRYVALNENKIDII